MNGWQEPNGGKRIYLITDNTKMDGFTDYIKPEDIEHLYVTYSESRVNLGIHYYRNSLYSSNLVGICRIKSVDDETLYDAAGNELLIKVVPRFNVTVVELLNYIRDRGDIVVSQDYGVAAMALGKGAFAIHQSGKWYTNDNIDQMLMERHLNKKARRSSHKNHIKGPKKRTEEDDERFTQSFEKMIKMAQESEM